MKDIHLRTIVSRLVKQADMALNPGERDYINREGLRWHRLFMNGQFQGGNSVPPAAAAQVQRMMQKFKDSYSGYAGTSTGNTQNDYSGMLFAIYAKDTAATDTVKRSMPPELQPTMQFVEDNQIRLIQPGEHDKNIGSPFWQSWNGGAYAKIYPQLVQNAGISTAPGLVSLRSEEEAAVARSKGWAAGPLVSGQTSRGFGPMIQSENKLVSALMGQEPSNQRRVFIDKVQPGASAVELLGNSARSLRQTKLRGGRITNNQEVSDQSARRDAAAQAIARSTAFVLFADDEGALYGKKILEMRGGKYVVSDESRYLTQGEVDSLLNPAERIKPVAIRPGKGEGKAGDKTGPWRFSPELAQSLEEGGNLSAEPYSFVNLRALRSHVDQSYQLENGKNEGELMHSPYEGFKIIMVGPIFSNPEHAGGQTTTSPNLAKPVHMVDPAQMGGNVAVNRGVQWVVVSNEIRPNAGAMDKPWTQVRGANESHVFKTAREAISHVMGSYVDESVEGNESLLNELARSVQVADNKLRGAAGLPPNPIFRPKSKPAAPKMQQPVSQPAGNIAEQGSGQPIQNMPQQSPYYTGYQQGMAGATAGLKALLRRIKG
jgi:hypothetical protein